jgi:hypothetical protein
MIVQVYVHPFARSLPRYYRCADKSLARPTSRCIFFDGENISCDASLVIYIYIYIYIGRYNPLWGCILQPSSGL